MSTLDPPAAQAVSRRGGLIAWGVVLIVVGVIFTLFMFVGLFAWIRDVERSLVTTPRTRGASRSTPTLSWTDIIGMLVVLLAGAGTVWTGIASCLGRRWVRPVIIVGSAFLTVLGLFSFIALALLLPSVLDALETAGQRGGSIPSSYSVIALFAIRLALVLAIGVVLPYLLFRFYFSGRTARALDGLDPRTLWSDRCPIPVLGWAALCALIGLSALLRLSEPALPAFTVVLKGAPAVVGLSAVAVLLLWGAWLCWRMERLGWMITFLLMSALRISTAVFLWTGGDPAELTSDAAAAASMARAQKADVFPEWLPAVMATIEAAVVIAFGIFVARYFPRGYRAGKVQAV